MISYPKTLIEFSTGREVKKSLFFYDKAQIINEILVFVCNTMCCLKIKNKDTQSLFFYSVVGK